MRRPATSPSVDANVDDPTLVTGQQIGETGADHVHGTGEVHCEGALPLLDVRLSSASMPPAGAPAAFTTMSIAPNSSCTRAPTASATASPSRTLTWNRFTGQVESGHEHVGRPEEIGGGPADPARRPGDDRDPWHVDTVFAGAVPR